jgi:predicted HTH transcriptional regulator
MKSDFIQNCIERIDKALLSETFLDIESGKIELKDLSSGGEWTSLKESVCAFLNTEGGIVICGVRERNKKYILNGFDRNNESKIIDLQRRSFKDDSVNFLDLSEYIFFDYYQIQSKDILVIAVYPLSDDLKFVSYNQKYYERKLTQDQEIHFAKLQRQKEYKRELEYAKEISYVEGASLDDLELDKINRYIGLLNLEIRNESLKESIEKAKEFLRKQYFVRDSAVSVLGLLVCGKDPFYYIGERAEVDCYYDTSDEIGKDKRIFRNDVVNLMEDAFRFVWGHINVSRSLRDGGKSAPEYPEKLIREIINNALAHRDYTINRFISISIEPNKHIEISNPGSFKEKIKLTNLETDIPIRRLIPGIPESKNPKLASVLKVFDKLESQGRGMASLVNAALDNLIDLPYYEIKQDRVRLVIPSGKLLDEFMESWIKKFNNYIRNKLKREPSLEDKIVLSYFYKSEILNNQRYFTILLSESNNHYSVINSLKQANLIYEHVASSDESVVYVLDRTLMKTRYDDELIDIVGEEYIGYDAAMKEILNIVYLNTKFNNTGLKASEITPDVYLGILGKIIEAPKYESLGRKVRALCNSLVDAGIFIKGAKNDYSFDLNYSHTISK